MQKQAKADVTPVRQRTQYTCMSTSMMMCLQANGIDCTEDEVNRVMGAKPMQGASWEDAAACAQHYGMRANLLIPATVLQLKEWTDRGVPVMIAWNPEDRDWSHASVVFDVEDRGGNLFVHVADPNMPNPSKVVRVVDDDTFYSKWAEKWPKYLVRRPAMAIEREITPAGRQVVASEEVVMARKRTKKKPESAKTRSKIKKEPPKAPRDPFVPAMRQRGGQGAHGTKSRKTERRKEKQRGYEREAGSAVNPPYDGNPSGKPIYENAVPHGYEQPLAGGTDVMKRLQDELRIEQGHEPREPNPRLAMVDEKLMDRAAGLLQWMSKRDAMKHLLDEGVSRSDAFLSIKAGLMLNERRSKSPRLQRQADNMPWLNLIEHPRASPTEPGVPGLIQPQRLLGQVDPEAAGAFWWCSKEPAEVWRNKYHHDRFVMTPNEGGPFVLVPPVQVGEWSSKGYQMVSQPQNPRLGANSPRPVSASNGGESDMDLTRDNLDKAMHRLARMAAAADEKEARNEKGKKISPDEMEKKHPGWKKNIEEHGDKFKPKAAADYDAAFERLSLLAADTDDGDDEKEAGCAKGDTSCDPTEHMSPEDKKKWEEHEGEIGKKARAAAQYNSPADKNLLSDATKLMVQVVGLPKRLHDRLEAAEGAFFDAQTSRDRRLLDQTRKALISVMQEVRASQGKKACEGGCDGNCGGDCKCKKTAKRVRLTHQKQAAAIDLWAAVYGNGALHGATDNLSGGSPRFWGKVASQDGFAVYKLARVPMDLAEKLIDHGTRAQAFPDGYKAWEAAKRFAKDVQPMHLAGDLLSQWGAVKTAGRASGMYGYTKRTENDVQASVRKLTRAAGKLARAAYKKDERVAPFLSTHAKRSGSTAAKVLVAALKDLGPKVAAQMDVAPPVEPEGKTASYSLYGYRTKTATLAVNACASLKTEAGRVASDLHRRRANKHANITGFLGEHCKQGRCMYARMIRDAYPEEGMRLASTPEPGGVEGWLTWED
jgi:hypothetical protein